MSAAPERILDEALDLFLEKGFDNASLRELAERMGFTKAALYYHFPSKADILMGLHLRMHSLIDEPLALLDDGDGPVSMKAYEAFLNACLERMQANEKLFALHRASQAAMSKRRCITRGTMEGTRRSKNALASCSPSPL